MFSHRHRPIMNYCWVQGVGHLRVAESMSRHFCPCFQSPTLSYHELQLGPEGGGRVWWSQCPDIPVPFFSHRHRPIMNYCWAQRGGGQPCMAESMSRHSCPCFQSPPSTFMNYWAGLGTVERAGVNVQTNLPVLSNRHRPIINYCWAHWHSNMHSEK